MLGELGKLLYELRFDFLAWRRLGASLCRLIVVVLSYRAARGTLVSLAASSLCILRFSDVNGEACCSVGAPISTSASVIFSTANDTCYRAKGLYRCCDYTRRALPSRSELHQEDVIPLIYTSTPTNDTYTRPREPQLPRPPTRRQRSPAAAHF